MQLGELEFLILVVAAFVIFAMILVYGSHQQARVDRDRRQ